MFETIAKELNWHQDVWCSLVQSRFKGEANVAYNSLSDRGARGYNVLKPAVLRAYQLTSEAYRQKIKNRKKDGEYFSEFISKEASVFD